MNNTDAIHKLEFMRDAYQKLIDENVDEGIFVGTDVTGTWKADTPLNEVYAEHVEALDFAISALKKQAIDKCCETCKYEDLELEIYPCCDCIRAKDHYEPYTEEES